MKYAALIIFTIFGTSTVFAAETIRTFTIENTIIIDADVDTVFEFAGNPLNDTEWRSEVNSMEASGPWEVGTIYYEDSHLGLNPHYLTPTILTELERPHRMVVETPEDHLYLRATRTFEPNDDGSTTMTYRLDVDTRMPRDATGLYLPQFVVNIYYNNVMRHYLWRLKNLLEN